MICADPNKPDMMSMKRYRELLDKEHGFELQKQLITRIRNEFKPTETQKAMPYYEMILELIKNA